MEIRIKATIPCNSYTLDQAKLLASMNQEIEALNAAVISAGGRLDVQLVRTTGPRTKKTAP
jgi:hypothetical protein